MSDRHDKWVQVSPGTVIPAGQPHRLECVEDYDETVPQTSDRSEAWFVDSSWKPPLDLPTEPTWGIVTGDNGYLSEPRKWRLTGDARRIRTDDRGFGIKREFGLGGIADFIPLTDEQVQRIEAAR